MIFLQITTTPADSVIVDGQAPITLMDLLMKGGYMMIPIFLLSILAVYVFVERILTLKNASKTPDAFFENIKGAAQA